MMHDEHDQEPKPRYKIDGAAAACLLADAAAAAADDGDSSPSCSGSSRERTLGTAFSSPSLRLTVDERVRK